MANDATTLTISIETILRGLDKALRGLSQLESQLKRVASVTGGTQGAGNLNRTAAATQRLQQQQQRAAVSAQRLAQSQQAVTIRAQQLANAQVRADQTTKRLELSQQRLNATATKTTQQLGSQADAHIRFFKATETALRKAPAVDAHVQAFRAIEKSVATAQAALRSAPPADAHVRAFKALERSAQDADSHVRAFRASEAALKKAPQLDAHVRAFRALEKGVDDADRHVKFFRANEAALAKAPQLDAHVRAFRALEQASARSVQGILSIGNALRSVGQDLASLGATLTVGLTAPLVALDAASVNAAVELDSLKRGLTAIVGSADEANRQLARLTQIAKLPGIGFEEAIQGSIRLQAVGFSAAEAEKSLREFSNAIALTGGGRDELARVTVQLGQLAAKGKVLSQDLRPIIEAAPAVGRALLQAFGTVNAADIQELGLSSKEFLGILTDELSRLPRAAAGAKNSFENFRDELFRAAAVVGEVLLPSLIRLVEVVGPIVTKLASAFAALPQPLQLAVLGVGALLVALGPVLFVVGQLTLGVGRLLVGFVELNAAGILPSIAGLRAYAVAALNAASAQQVLASTTTLVTAGIGAGLAVIAAAVAAYAIYNAFQKDAVTLSKERADQLTAEIKSLEEQAKFLNGLQEGVKRTADEQQRLDDIYNKLNTTAQIRVAGITDEAKRLVVLRAELEKLITLRGQEQVQQAANVAAQVVNDAALIDANNRSRASLAERIAANNALVETLEREGRVSQETGKQLERLGITAGSDVRQAIFALQRESANLVRRQKELGDNTAETEEELQGYLEALTALDPQHRLSARALLVLARNMGLFKGDVEAMVPVLEQYIAKTDEATSATNRLNNALSENARRLNEAGDRADKAAKARRELIDSAAAVARETSVDFDGALKSLRQMVDAVPELRAALSRESELTGKSLSELLHDTLESAFKGRAKDRSGTGLRNAQEALAKALAEVSLASADQQVQIENKKNERLITAAESAQRQQLISYRQFLEFRAQLTAENLDRDIAQQATAVAEAKKRQAGLLLAAKKSGIPQAESVRRQAQAAEAQEEAIKAETKLKDLQGQRENVTFALNQLIAEGQHQQLADVRQLEIRYAELQGRIEDALNAAAVEEFRESLTDLSKAQEFLNRQLEAAVKARDADRIAQIQQAQALNQRQIEAIRNQVTARNALAQLAAAEKLVENAKERQAKLEAGLTFQVEFRGLREEDAIQQRLDGERKLQSSLELSRSIIEDVIASFTALGRTPPPELQKFIDGLKQAQLGLGELSFSEQFRLAEKEFTRLNDERLQKIADVERAVRNRDIAEAEGLLLIRRINGDYVGDLERQLELLRQIAAASGDATLQQQAADAAESAKDAADQLASLTKQVQATAIDSLQESFTNFLVDITDRTKNAKETFLEFVGSISGSIKRVIAENLSRKLVESLLGTGGINVGGIIERVKRLFGFGGGEAGVGGAGVAAASAATQTAATTAAATLQTGATTAAATTTASAVTFSTAITTAATAFASVITAAGAAFAAAITAAAGAQAASGATSAIGSGIGNFATGDILPARQGGRLVRVAEAGHAEAVLTTDPQHAVRQARLLSRFLRLTKGLQGRFPVPELASGALVTPRATETALLNSIERTPLSNANIGALPLAAAGGGTLRLRQVLTDERNVGDWLNSSEGERVFVDKLIRNRALIRDLGGKR